MLCHLQLQGRRCIESLRSSSSVMKKRWLYNVHHYQSILFANTIFLNSLYATIEIIILTLVIKTRIRRSACNFLDHSLVSNWGSRKFIFTLGNSHHKGLPLPKTWYRVMHKKLSFFDYSTTRRTEPEYWHKYVLNRCRVSNANCLWIWKLIQDMQKLFMVKLFRIICSEL